MGADQVGREECATVEDTVFAGPAIDCSTVKQIDFSERDCVEKQRWELPGIDGLSVDSGCGCCQ